MNNSIVKISKDLISRYIIVLYLLQPVYIDSRGDKIREKIRKFLSIDENQEEQIMRRLLEKRNILKVGDFIYVDKKMKYDIERLIDLKKVNISDLIKII